MRSAEIGVGADRVLIAAGHISYAYALAFAHWLNMPFEPLDERRRLDCPLDGDRLIDAGAVGLMPLRLDGQNFLVVAPRDTRRLTAFLRSPNRLAPRLRITTPARLTGFAARHGATAIGHRAAHALRRAKPDMSAGSSHPRRWLAAFSVASIVAAAALAAPHIVSLALDAALALIFLGWAGLRLIGALAKHSPEHAREELRDSQLPIYTLIVALYREAPAVAGLINALAALDYPPEKLDIKLVVEQDDADTLGALAMLDLRAPFEIVTAPGIGPRTKPKALNAALPFARGTFVAVYDAEDRPEPGQLRIALDAFRAADRRLACVQARLTIDNTADSWLTRLFTAEYAGLFDVFLPGLAARRLPLPLGGSSNHFRTAVVREIGAWDAYNVTEDADLGLRIARAGLTTRVLDSITLEEANSDFVNWVKQRSRWYKGYLQTWIVHNRHPRSLIRAVGWRGYVGFTLFVAGTPVLAMLNPAFWYLAVMWFVAEPDTVSELFPGPIYYPAMLSSVVGNFAMVYAGLISARAAQRQDLVRAAVTVPIYWVMMSLGAVKAAIQLVLQPSYWEKTTHGLSDAPSTSHQSVPHA